MQSPISKKRTVCMCTYVCVPNNPMTKQADARPGGRGICDITILTLFHIHVYIYIRFFPNLRLTVMQSLNL